ncbi:MAG: GMC oxidoreductase [Parvularculaceae bacterium]
MTDEDIVIGSGPAGVSAAHALLARGRRVVMIDVGETLEPEHAARRERMAATGPDAWLSADIDAATHVRRSARSDVMRPFGSDFPIRDAVGFFGGKAPPADLALRPSFARGGLSNGWGSSVLPYRIEDMTAWPAAAKDLAAHYEAVSRFAPISAAHDDLEALFPLWRVDAAHAYPPGPQGATFLSRLAQRKDALAREGVTAGRSRLAFAGEACRTCGLCLYGCPYGVIFNAAGEVEKLLRHARFRYAPQKRAVRFEEHGDGVRVTLADARSGASETIDAARLFIGAGVLPTARIVLNSLPGQIERLTLLDSQHLLMPMLHQWAPPADIATTPQNTLAQAFIELSDARLSPSMIHAQVYAYNDFLKSDLQLKFGALSGVLEPVIDAVSRRLLVAQLFAHSDHCGRIELTRNGDPGDARLTYKARESDEAGRVLKAAAGRLARALLPSGVIAMPFQARMGAVGSSFHVGGSLPMAERPRAGETDVFGRIAGTTRTHVIDASVFPSVPATTITFTVMANAHRIASEAPL